MWNGELTALNPEVTVNTDVVCLNDTITFTLDGTFTDSGGLKRVDCTPTTLGPSIKYEWVITKPDAIMVSGTGVTAIVVADLAGPYSVTFTVSSDRECPPTPNSITIDLTVNVGELALAATP